MNKAYKYLSCLIITVLISSCGSGSGVFFENLKDGATVDQSVTVKMGVQGMEIESAGPVNAGKGHHHIIIDGEFIPGGEPVPADATHIHFGKGQTEVQLNLTPGEHTLTLQFADGIHTSYGEAWSKTITVVAE
jgi:uncharacterized protein DUF4399